MHEMHADTHTMRVLRPVFSCQRQRVTLRKDDILSITSIDKEYVAGTYGRFPVELISGKGSVLTDTNGKEYIDLGSGIGVTAFGFGDEKWAKAVT